MATKEIPRDEWVAFFDSFSRQHEGWLVTIEVSGASPDAQASPHELTALRGITVVLKGEGHDMIAIVSGEAREEEAVAHTVNAPTRVLLEQSGHGAHESLQIESADGANTTVCFRSVVLPEMVDGLVSG